MVALTATIMVVAEELLVEVRAIINHRQMVLAVLVADQTQVQAVQAETVVLLVVQAQMGRREQTATQLTDLPELVAERLDEL